MNTRTIIKIAGVITIAAALGATSGIVLGASDGQTRQGATRLLHLASSESDEHEEHERKEHQKGESGKMNGAASQADQRRALYASECSGCHFAYPTRALPAGSWKKIMAQLDRHFGENAELDAADRQAITGYLVTHAGNRAWMVRMTSSGKVPMRISKLPWFVRRHHEVPMRVVRDNPKVRSFSNCDACHTRAAKGSYDEDEVRIPGARNWES